MAVQQHVKADPDGLMAIRSLQWRAVRAVDGHRQGLHRSVRPGTSAEFREYRDYTPGDDLRYFDWKLLARRDRMSLKRFDGETNLRCELVVDFSPSMFFGTVGYKKSDYAATLAATVSRFLLLQGDAVGLMTIRGLDRMSQCPCLSGTPRFRPIVAELERALQGTEPERLPTVGPDCETVFERIAAKVRRRSLMVIISDLLVPPEALLRGLSWPAARGHEMLVLQVLDPAELDFRTGGPVVLEDLETGQQLAVDPEPARERYAERLRIHIETIEAGCRKLGISFRRISTDQPLTPWLQELVLTRDRARRSRSGSR